MVEQKPVHPLDRLWLVVFVAPDRPHGAGWIGKSLLLNRRPVADWLVEQGLSERIQTFKIPCRFGRG